jgi:hypothetical protein
VGSLRGAGAPLQKIFPLSKQLNHSNIEMYRLERGSGGKV